MDIPKHPFTSILVTMVLLLPAATHVGSGSHLQCCLQADDDHGFVHLPGTGVKHGWTASCRRGRGGHDVMKRAWRRYNAGPGWTEGGGQVKGHGRGTLIGLRAPHALEPHGGAYVV